MASVVLTILLFTVACVWAFFAPTLGYLTAEWLHERERERWRREHPNSVVRY